MANVSTGAIAGLKSKIQGQVILPGDATYDEVRSIWNAMIDKRPAVIVQCAAANDVPAAIGFARQHGLEISIRGAGHNIAGNALCDGGLLIDHSNMKAVTVDTDKRRASAEPETARNKVGKPPRVRWAGFAGAMSGERYSEPRHADSAVGRSRQRCHACVSECGDVAPHRRHRAAERVAQQHGTTAG